MQRREPGLLLDPLLREAASDVRLVRALARGALVMIKTLGIDVTATPFAGREVGLPRFGTVRAQLMG